MEYAPSNHEADLFGAVKTAFNENANHTHAVNNSAVFDAVRRATYYLSGRRSFGPGDAIDVHLMQQVEDGIAVGPTMVFIRHESSDEVSLWGSIGEHGWVPFSDKEHQRDSAITATLGDVVTSAEWNLENAVAFSIDFENSHEWASIS